MFKTGENRGKQMTEKCFCLKTLLEILKELVRSHFVALVLI